MHSCKLILRLAAFVGRLRRNSSDFAEQAVFDGNEGRTGSGRRAKLVEPIRSSVAGQVKRQLGTAPNAEFVEASAKIVFHYLFGSAAQVRDFPVGKTLRPRSPPGPLSELTMDVVA